MWFSIRMKERERLSFFLKQFDRKLQCCAIFIMNRNEMRENSLEPNEQFTPSSMGVFTSNRVCVGLIQLCSLKVLFDSFMAYNVL